MNTIIIVYHFGEYMLWKSTELSFHLLIIYKLPYLYTYIWSWSLLIMSYAYKYIYF